MSLDYDQTAELNWLLHQGDVEKARKLVMLAGEYLNLQEDFQEQLNRAPTNEWPQMRINTMHNPEAYTALGKCLKGSNVRTLNLPYYNINTPEELTLLTKALKESGVTTLDLSCNEIGSQEAIIALNEGLKGTSVTSLDISNNLINDVGVKAIADMLKTNTTLTRIDIDSNKFGDDGAAAIAEALKTNTTLISINFWGNNIDANILKTINVALERNKQLAAEKEQQKQAPSPNTLVGTANSRNKPNLESLQQAARQGDMHSQLILDDIYSNAEFKIKQAEQASKAVLAMETNETLQAAMNKTKQQSALPPLPPKAALANAEATEEVTKQRKRGSSAFKMLSGAVSSLTERVRRGSTERKEVAGQVTEVSLKVTNVNLQVGDVSQQLGSVSLQVASHNQSISHLQNAVTILQEDVKTLNREITAIEGIDPTKIKDVFEVVQNSRALLKHHTNDLQEIATMHVIGKRAETELQESLSDDKAQEYYLDVIRLINGVYAASSSVGSNWVGISKSGKIGGFGTLLRIAGGFSPVGGNAIGAAGELLNLIGKRIQKENLIKFVALCPSPGDMDNIAKMVALKLVQEGRENSKASTDVAAILNAVFAKDSKIIQNTNLSVIASQFVEAATGKANSVNVLSAKVATEFDSDNLFATQNQEVLLRVVEVQKRKEQGVQKFAGTQEEMRKTAKQLEVNSLNAVLNGLRKNKHDVKPGTVLAALASPEDYLKGTEGVNFAKSLLISGSKTDQIKSAMDVTKHIITESGIKNPTTKRDVAKVMEINITTNAGFREFIIRSGQPGSYILGPSLEKAISGTDANNTAAIKDKANKWCKDVADQSKSTGLSNAG